MWIFDAMNSSMYRVLGILLFLDFDISGQDLGNYFSQRKQDSARLSKIVERNRKPRCQELGNFDAINSRLKSVLYCRRNCESWLDSTYDSTRSNLCDVKQASSRKRKKLKYEHNLAYSRINDYFRHQSQTKHYMVHKEHA